MSRSFHLEIVTPTALHDLGAIEYLRAPGVDGLFGVEGGHAHALISIGTGELKVVTEGKTTYWATSGGFAEINPDQTQLLLETVELAEKVDRKRAEAASERARKYLEDDTKDHARAKTSLQRAMNRLKVSSH